MQDDVPLVVPEINPDHLGLVQKNAPIVTNPNCATVGLALTLKPLVDAFGVDRVQVTTMQAVSGAGYPGVSQEAVQELSAALYRRLPPGRESPREHPATNRRAHHGAAEGAGRERLSTE